MRPLRIELEGFSAFRASTVVDFDDADLFAFVGPTGAGKSSVIDGMIFALYGSVPRYGREGLVHPVISQGKPEARVRLDFEIRGVRHTAVRVVRRTKTGASTKEARLERGGEVLAADAPSVTAAVCDLLGLDLEQFTKCVVLPQGAFAALLHDTTSRRQDLLVKLLDFGVYEQVAIAARRRVQAADQRRAVLDEQLAALAHATDQAVERAAQRIATVDAVIRVLDAAAPELAALDDKARTVHQQTAQLRAQLDALADVTVPSGVDSVAAQVRDTAAAVTAAGESEAATAAAVDRAQAARADLGDPTEVRRLLDAHAALADLAARVARGRQLVAEHEEAVVPLRRAADDAAAVEEAAAEALAGARVAHAASDLVRHLSPGDDCPVCGNQLVALPELDTDELEVAEQGLARARAAGLSASRALAEAERELAGLRSKLEEREDEHRRAAAVVADAPAPGVLHQQLASIEAAEHAVAAARAADRDARTRSAEARAAAAAAAAAETSARAEYAATRDRVAALAPPAPGDDLAADWAALDAWAIDQRRHLDQQLSALERERAAITSERRQVEVALVEAATDAEIEVVEPGHLRDACVTAAADARGEHRRLVDDRRRASEHRSELETVAEARAVHDLVATELGPKRFEAWLLDEALTSLVGGASERLEQLSSGRYAMAVDDKKQFEVIDHANADERRLARTLSGGETFLASLALALALAERVSELSASGQASLEAIFLDEGFGTLDPETLDVVATAIEELGASGRMVGVVSHVRELAERVPVRFEVHRGPDTSTVVRVDT